MVTVYDVPADRLLAALAEELKPRISQPAWAPFVKTGVSRERPPEQGNWWHLRAASLLRRAYIDGPVGVSRLRSYYGGLHRRGHKPAHFARGGGKIIRTLLQDLEKAGLLKKEKKGRSITPEGQKLLDAVAKKISVQVAA